jgi:hypothetical protein
MTVNFIYNLFSIILNSTAYISILLELHTDIPYFIVWDVQYGDHVEICGFWQGQGVRSSDIYEQS